MASCKIVFIVGMAGSGKSIISDELVKEGFSYVRFGQIVIDEIKKRGLEVNETNEKTVREELRREHGMGAMAKLNMSLQGKSILIVDDDPHIREVLRYTLEKEGINIQQ